MALHRDIQRPGQAWLRAAFERTRLPRNGLADYLELDYASVSRLLTGHRLLDPNELALARGYFSIVPERLSPDALEAIDLLRSAKVREFAATRYHCGWATRLTLISFTTLEDDRSSVSPSKGYSLVASAR